MMATDMKNKEKEITDSLVGAASYFEGTLEFKGCMRIDGRIKGVVRSDEGTLIVGDTAQIHGDIHVGVAIIRGAVEGTIRANERIELYPPGNMNGNIIAPVVSVDTGVIFNGKCEMSARVVVSGKKKDTP